MQTAPVAPLVTFEGEGDKRKKIETAQHSHQCGWCGRMFGEFTDKECSTEHKSGRCTLECEENQPGRLLDPLARTPTPLNNPIAIANWDKVKPKE